MPHEHGAAPRYVYASGGWASLTSIARIRSDAIVKRCPRARRRRRPRPGRGRPDGRGPESVRRVPRERRSARRAGRSRTTAPSSRREPRDDRGRRRAQQLDLRQGLLCHQVSVVRARLTPTGRRAAPELLPASGGSPADRRACADEPSGRHRDETPASCAASMHAGRSGPRR